MTTVQVSEIPFGWCHRVRARLRAVEPHEIPPGVATDDSRMVEFYTRKQKGLRTIADIGLYDPLQEDDLLGQFLGVFGGSPPTDRQVIEFYRRYGYVTDMVTADGERLPAWAWRLAPESRVKLSTEARFGQCEPLWWVRECAQEVRLTYHLYEALRAEDIGALRALLGGVPQGKAILSVAIVAGRIVHSVVAEEEVGHRQKGSVSIDQQPASMGDSQQSLRPLTEEECLHWASRILATQLNDAEKKTWHEWLDRDDLIFKALLKGQPEGEAPESHVSLVRVRGYRGLATALYLQLGDLIMANQALHHCPGCQRLFHPKRSDQLYCTRGCGDAARQRGYYRERKEQPASPRRRKSKRAKSRR